MSDISKRLCNPGYWLILALLMATGLAGAAERTRYLDYTKIKHGRQVFLEHCAVCHGPRAEGAPNWRYREGDGTYPPPPLNGEGHTWHHPLRYLKAQIENGSKVENGRMPAWKGILSEQEIDDVIVWFQFLWPDPVYDTWKAIDDRSRDGRDE